MKVTIELPPPQPVAVVNLHANVVFFPLNEDQTVMIQDGVATVVGHSLKNIINQGTDRTVIYEGNSITLTF